MQLHLKLINALPPSERPACWLGHVNWLPVSKYKNSTQLICRRFHILFQLKSYPISPARLPVWGHVHQLPQPASEKPVSRSFLSGRILSDKLRKSDSLKEKTSSKMRSTAVIRKRDKMKSIQGFTRAVSPFSIPYFKLDWQVARKIFKMDFRDYSSRGSPLTPWKHASTKIVSCLPTLWWPGNSKPDWWV